jgi:hypothetical protein
MTLGPSDEFDASTADAELTAITDDGREIGVLLFVGSGGRRLAVRMERLEFERLTLRMHDLLRRGA